MLKALRKSLFLFSLTFFFADFLCIFVQSIGEEFGEDDIRLVKASKWKLAARQRGLPHSHSSAFLDRGKSKGTFKVATEFEKKNEVKKEGGNGAAARRPKNLQAKFKNASSYQVQLHYNESLEFFRRARQLQPVVQEYLDCVNRTAQLYKRTGRITSRASMKLVGEEFTLKCRDCYLPGKESGQLNLSTIEWRMIPYNEPRDINIIFDSEKFLFNADTADLSIKDLTLFDSGRYRCVVNHETVRIYDLQVVETDRTTTVFENAADGPTPSPPVELMDSNVKFYTNWDNWASCNECGIKSTRRRIGICMVEKLNYQSPITPVDYPAFNMYGWGLPCRSVLIPRNFSDEFADHLKRPSEVEIGHCEHPCPTAPPMIFITDENGKIIDQYERTEGGVYSLESGPPKLPPLVQRITAYEEEGDRIRMICPKASGKSVRWQNCSTTDKGLLCRPVDPFHAEKLSQGRIVVTIVNALLIKRITFFDVGIYSCYYDGRLVATTKLFVNPKRNRNLKKTLTIFGIFSASFFFFMIIVFVIKNM